MSVRARGVLRVLFGVAAGPRAGFGHLVRARSLARALGVPPVAALRGTDATRRRARQMGVEVLDAGAAEALRRVVPDAIVVDDPSEAAVRAWVRRARRAGVPVATVHDLGIAAVASDLVIDGTIAPRARVRGVKATLHGPDYMILDPSIRATRDRAPRPAPGRVLLALGGGGTAAAASRLARAIAARREGIDIAIAGGFAGRRRGPDGLAAELARAEVAVVGGGVTLYEACALGVPAIAVAMTPAQRVTVRAFARRGAAVNAGEMAQIASEVERLLRDSGARRRLAAAGRRLVDGRGAFRVAEQVRRLAAAGKVRDVA